MNTQGYIATYDLILTARAPLFIGSGKEYGKKEYLYDEKSRKVSILDPAALMRWIVSNNLYNDYERFVLSEKTGLDAFFKRNGVSGEELSPLVLYSGSVGEALVPGKALAAIKAFVHDGKLRPYIPGSSVKGALRTAILTKKIRENSFLGEKIFINEREKSQNLENRILNKLKLKKDKEGKAQNDPINSVMRGISISDSEPVPRESMILAKKEDLFPSGGSNTINVVRECIRPGTEIRLKLSLDMRLLEGTGVNVSFLRAAIAEFGTYYRETYMKQFPGLPKEAVQESFENCLVLGGGSGYFGKNLVYPLKGKKEGARIVSGIMDKKFKKHRHQEDFRKGLSPRCLKYTSFRGEKWHFGVCSVKLAEDGNK